MPDNISDRELVKAFREGDKEAFGDLVRKYQKQIYHFAFGIMTNHHLAEDVSQEAFIRFWKSLRSGAFDTTQLVYPYLRTICLNLSRDYLSERKHNMKPIDGIDVAVKSDCGEKIDVDKEQVRQAIESLVPEYRMVLTLRVIEGLSYEAISKAVNCPVGTVMSRLFRARTELRSKLNIKEQNAK